MPFAQHSILKTSRAASTFLLCSAWLVLSLAAAGEMSRLAPPAHVDLVREAMAALLLFGGFYVASKMFLHDVRPLSNVGFVRRPGMGGEFARGLALGWAVAILLVLPALLTRNLHMTFAFDGPALLRTIEAVATLVAFAFVVQLVLGGLPVRMLLKATGATWASVAVVTVVALLTIAAAQGRSVLFAALAGYLFVTAFLRTRAIWLSLGLQLGWTVGLEVLFGATSPYTPSVNGVISSNLGGPAWMTGSAFGPEGSLLAVLVVTGAAVALFRMTKEYAWHYTWTPLEGAGVATEIAPPAEHLREEKKHAAPLVQIGGIAPAPPQRSE